jgi:hypothetical protein
VWLFSNKLMTKHGSSRKEARQKSQVMSAKANGKWRPCIKINYIEFQEIRD